MRFADNLVTLEFLNDMEEQNGQDKTSILTVLFLHVKYCF